MFSVIVNQEFLDLDEYGDQKIKREARYFDFRTNAYEPARANMKVSQTQLEDDLNLFQFQIRPDEFMIHEIHDFKEERMNFLKVFPTEEKPDTEHTYMYINFNYDTTLRKVSRQKYGLLDWFGDWGGLLDALF